jgi:hypothetical protein
MATAFVFDDARSLSAQQRRRLVEAGMMRPFNVGGEDNPPHWWCWIAPSSKKSPLPGGQFGGFAFLFGVTADATDPRDRVFNVSSQQQSVARGSRVVRPFPDSFGPFRYFVATRLQQETAQQLFSVSTADLTYTLQDHPQYHLRDISMATEILD